MTRAPASARRQVHSGAATACSTDTTSIPSSGRPIFSSQIARTKRRLRLRHFLPYSVHEGKTSRYCRAASRHSPRSGLNRSSRARSAARRGPSRPATATGNTTGGAPIFETLIRSAHSAQGPTPHPPPGTPPEPPPDPDRPPPIIEPPDPVPVPPVEPPPPPVRDPPVRQWASGIAWRARPIGRRIAGSRMGIIRWI